MVVLFFTYIIFILTSKVFKQDLKIYFIFTTLVLATLAFFYVPNHEADLTLAYEHLNAIREYGWKYILETQKWTTYFNGLPTLQIYFYLISLLQLNNFLPCITVIIIYGLTLHRVYTISKVNNLSNNDAFKIGIFILLFFDFHGLVSGIRNLLAFSIFSYFLYIDLIENKNKILCWFMYLISFGIHSSCSILIIIRLLLYIKLETVKVILIVLMIQLGNIIELLSEVLNKYSGNFIISIIYMKFKSYTEGGNEDNMRIPYYYQLIINNRVILCISMIILILILWYKNNSIRKNSLILVYFYICIFLLGIYLTPKVSYHVFVRYSNMLILLAPIVWGSYYSNCKKIKVIKFSEQLKIKLVDIPFFIILLVGLYYMMRYSYYTMEFGFKIFN